MKAFATLCNDLRRAPDPAEPLAAHLRRAADADRLAAIALLSGRWPKRLIAPAALDAALVAACGVPAWLMAECQRATGNSVDALALMLPPADHSGPPLAPSLSRVLSNLEDLRSLPLANVISALLSHCTRLNSCERAFFIRLVTGRFRLRLPPETLTDALARVTGQPGPAIALHLTSAWDWQTHRFATLFGTEMPPIDQRQPHAFATPAPWAGPLPQAMLAEAELGADPLQLIVRSGHARVWSARGVWCTDAFPALADLCRGFPCDAILCGTVGAKVSGPATPGLPFVAQDLLELAQQDIRALPATERRARLTELLAGMPHSPALCLSQAVMLEARADPEALWPTLNHTGATGLRLTRSDAGYGTPGSLWLWHPAAHSFCGVLLYAQNAPAGLLDLTFAGWDGADLRPLARVRTPADGDLRSFIATHTTDRFGPVRQLSPLRVAELAFDRIVANPRRKSGIDLRNPRLLRWRPDLAPSDAGHCAALRPDP